jgi:hypothetical protein
MLRSFASLLLLLASATTSLAAEIVITGGRVIDPETGLDAIRSVWRSTMARLLQSVSSPLDGDTVIDATGKVVSPGFIDLHAHGQNIGDYRMYVMQGVTTSLELESGVLPIADWYDGQARKTCRSTTVLRLAGPTAGSRPFRHRSAGDGGLFSGCAEPQ